MQDDDRTPAGTGVPNAPCGVERRLGHGNLLQGTCVPNAPCGVERGALFHPITSQNASFLMHRVELKDAFGCRLAGRVLKTVPNAPCGVERSGQVGFLFKVEE